KDTLLAGGRLKVDISMMKLLKNEVEVNDLRLDRLTAKVKRVLPDTTFNFQFIVDAFASGPKDTTKKTDTSALKIAIKYVQLDRIRLVYNDVITGNDVDVWLQHFETNIDKFDLNAQRFDVPIAKLQGLRARVYQTKPFVEQKTEAQHVAEANEPSTMQLNFKRLLLDDINLDYKNDVSALYSTLALGKLELNINKLDLVNRVIDLDNIQLDRTIAAIRLGKKEQAAVVKEEVNQKVEAQAETNWRVTVKKIRLNENNLQFDDGSKPRLSKGIDYAHLNASGLTFHIDNLLYSKDSIAGSITQARMKEQSGLQLNRLETDFLYAANQAYFKNLILQTPGTEIQRSVVLQYPSIDVLKDNLGALRLDVDLHSSKIHVKDILTFVPTLSSQPALANPASTIFLTGRLTGSIARLGIQTLQIRALQDTRVNVNGTVIGLPDMKKAGGNLTITELSTSRRDIVLLAPKGSLPATITIPERIKVTGRISGGMNNVSPNLLISTSLGSASVRGSVKQPTDKNRSQYDLVLETNRLDLGTLLQNKENLGTLSARFTAKGRGFDPKTANATLNGVVRSAMVKNYNYRDFKLMASIANQHLDAKASIHDPNIDFSLDASGNMSGKYPSITLNATIDSIKTLPLHLTTDSILYRGIITANFPVTDPDNLEGDLLVTKSLLVKNSERLELDTIQLAAGKNDSGQFVRLSADAINVALHGKYRLTQLGSVFQQAIEPYFALAANSKAVKVDPYDFSFTGSIVNKPILQTFLP
ncbi:MAG TPA: hypothetical protein VEZ17_04745, partial [Chitinophagaceae bacterium]|nr:hypothetical protein [Chitinophagaceae bacterium]